MALKDAKRKPADFKEDAERKFNQTVVKVVETKTFLLDAVARTVNKTADKLLATKQHLKETKEALKTKMVASIDESAKKLEKMKEDFHDYKRAKEAQSGNHQIGYVSRDFLVAPVFLINENAPTVPFSVSENYKQSIPTDATNMVSSSFQLV